jgi:hypothetical protein
MDFPSNSHKDKEVKAKRPEKKVEKVVTSAVVPRKRSMGSKFKDVFVGGEAKSALRYIGYEVLLPALRNMIVDATTKGIERVIYGDASPRRSYGPNTRVSYNTPVSRYNTRTPAPYDRSPINRRPIERHEVTELIFASREEAEQVLEMVTEIIDTYEMASVADLHQLAGLPSTHVDNKWGWSNIAGVTVRQIREGFLIDFPPVEPI